MTMQMKGETNIKAMQQEKENRKTNVEETKKGNVKGDEKRKET